MNARETCRRQQLREAAFGLARFDRDTVQQKPVIGNAQQKSGFAGFRERGLQFSPGDLELAFRPLVFDAVKARVFHKDVEAMHEGASGSGATLVGCARGRNTPLLVLATP